MKFLTFLILFSMQVFAGEMESETSVGTDLFSENLTYTEVHKISKQEKKSYSAGFLYNNQNSSQSYTVNADIIQKNETWKYRLALLFGTTPEESMFQVGPNGSVTYTLNLTSQQADFVPNLQFKIGYQLLDYVQTFASPGRLGRRVRQAAIHLLQNQFTAGMGVNLLNWLGLNFSYSLYVYSQDVRNFVNTLDSLSAVQSALGNFSSLVAGFPGYMASTGATVYLSEDWELDLDANYANNALDGSTGYGLEARIQWDASEHFRLGAGAQRNVLTSGTLQYVGIFNLTYIF